MAMNLHASVASSGPASAAGPRSYCYRHTVSFEETNVVGNVYFTRHISWQGRCRELFLRDYAPDTLDDLKRDLRLVPCRAASPPRWPSSTKVVSMTSPRGAIDPETVSLGNMKDADQWRTWRHVREE
jgi:hypothetical protein